ncbi:group 1 glycosyl transferase [Salinisphaera dokdonensis CL-ES53]|uniref:Group 1 glycosyl transferase n=1 Tax=Salinisphaera dokdonensis CL-ES53 TaxID=1304272 RepID=A0ABV2B479_9GAMM
MRILYHHRIGSKDGQYVHIREVVAALQAQGHEVRVVGPGGFEDRPFGGESGLVARLKQFVPAAFYEILEFGYNLLDYRRLAAEIRRFRPDVIYERYNLYLLSGVLARRAFRLPLLLEINAPLYEERSAYGGLRLKRLARWAERQAWRKADRIFTVTHVLAQHITAAGVAAERVVVTPNGVDLGTFPRSLPVYARREALGIDTPLVVGFVGFAREWHGLDAVIRLLAARPQSHTFHFLLVGDGPACEGLRRQAAATGVAHRVTITGLIEREQIADYVRVFDIALQPAVVAYASPLKLLEYMASSCAIVAPDAANIKELLIDNENALLFDTGATRGFETAVMRLLEDGSLRERLGRSARATVESRDLTWACNARCIASTAGELLAGRRDRQPAWSRR